MNCIHSSLLNLTRTESTQTSPVSGYWTDIFINYFSLFIFTSLILRKDLKQYNEIILLFPPIVDSRKFLLSTSGQLD